MLSVAIVEDELQERNRLKKLLFQYSEEVKEELTIKEFEDASKFLWENKNKYDVIFLDIELPTKNGIEAAEEIRKYDEQVPIVFVTSSAKYALQGYKVSALDYFLKPVGYYDLKMRMEQVRTNICNRVSVVEISLPGIKKRMQASRIYYIEIMKHQLTYHTEDGNFVVNRGVSLKNLEAELSKAGFCRCSACYLVNLRWCSEITSDSVVCGKQHETLKMSRLLKKDFINALSDFMGMGQ